MSAGPKSILKKRPHAAVEPEAEERPLAPGQAVSDEPIHPVNGKGKDVEDADAADADEDDDDEDDESDDQSTADEDEFSVGSDDESGADEDDEDAIREMLEDGQERPAKKLKHTTLRPSTASAFSSSLQHLISLPSTASNPIPKHAPPSAATLRLERKTRAVIRETKAAHLARGHVRDVIGGWGPRPPLPFSEWESKAARDFEAAKRGGKLSVEEGETSAEREKRLRKLAQRGVVRLFNAIGAAQGVAGKDKDVEEQEKRRKLAVKVTAKDGEGEGAAPTISRRPNILGARGKNDALTSLSKASFLDLIRAGTGA
ncbi:hypothetical protein RHOSPDRAFT_16900 [Rhodotorula sp. JG-1b]|nr:hypothetical protein RHOSPDRAFT_16900 [Rhodotorula sp. JG-1b]